MLKTFLQQIIEASPQQKITFAQFMQWVLYHPQWGYYNKQTPKIGKAGDFFTSSSLGKDFGELLAEQVVEMVNILDTDQFTLLEMGAGAGDLVIDLLGYLELRYPQVFKTLTYLILEESLTLKQQQQQRLQALPSLMARAQWVTWEEICDRKLIGCCLSNELIDALPVHRVTVQQGELKEIYLTWQDGGLKEVLGELSTPKIGDYFDRLDIDLTRPIYQEGYCTEVNLAALDWLEKVNQSLDVGYVLTIDYGYPAAKYYHPQRHQGTLQCYYQHRHHSNPYVNLGEQDITAHVDFTTLDRYGQELGLETLGFTQQGLFLMALGLGDRLADLSNGSYPLPVIFQRRDALHQLIDPTGLGRFGVLIQGKGLSATHKLLTGLRSG